MPGAEALRGKPTRQGSVEAVASSSIKMTISKGVLDAVGKTPLVSLERIFQGLDLRLLAKVEALNPGGSIKDRAALQILEDALELGKIRSDTVVIESTSGNMGVGLAQVCAYYGLRLICVVDPKTVSQNIKILRSYGAEVDYVGEPDPQTGEFLQARLNRVQELLAEFGNAFWPNQYNSPSNPRAHYETTMREVFEAAGRVDYLFVSTSTCGTLRGCAEFARDHQMETQIIAVDARGSQIFSREKAERLIPGLGAGIVPPLCDHDLVDRFVLVSNLDCVVGCRRLARREAILAGGSSGGVIAAVNRLAPELKPGATCVAILPDRGERYLETVFSDEWVAEHFGDVSFLWEDGERARWEQTALSS